MRGRWNYTYESAHDSYAANTRSDLDHAVVDELELVIGRRDISTHGYSQRPERCDDERSERVVEFI